MKVSPDEVWYCGTDFSLVGAVLSLFRPHHHEVLFFHEPADYFLRDLRAVSCQHNMDTPVFVASTGFMERYAHAFTQFSILSGIDNAARW